MTTKTITESQIRALRTEAAGSGDFAQLAICDLALDGSFDADDYTVLEARDAKRIASMSQEQAIAECARVIAEAPR